MNCVDCRESVAVTDHVGKCLPVDGTQLVVCLPCKFCWIRKEGEAESLPLASGLRRVTGAAGVLLTVILTGSKWRALRIIGRLAVIK